MLCEDCVAKFCAMSAAAGEVKAEWACPMCGRAVFTKGADPHPRPAPESHPSAVWPFVALIVCVVVVAIAVVLTAK